MVTLPLQQEVATARDQLHWSKALPLLLLFNDNKDIKLFTSSFLYKNSTFLQAFDLEEDTTLRSGASSAGNVINILCPSSFIMNNKKCLFNDEIDLSFMFTLKPYKFINVCRFLDIICYENKDKSFSKEFITYVMNSIYIKKHINKIQYFMQPEIRSIMNYINNESIDKALDLQIKSCTPTFYFLYLNEYIEYVIKHNRRDIYELSTDKREYYKYMHKYDNQLTYDVKETKKYKKYIDTLNEQLFNDCRKETTITNIKNLVSQGANIHFKSDDGHSLLHYAVFENNIEVINYLVEQGLDINLKDDTYCASPLLSAVESTNIEVVQYLLEHGADVNSQDYAGYTALQHIIIEFMQYGGGGLDIIRLLVDYGADINIQHSSGCTALHFATDWDCNFEIVQYLIEHSIKFKIPMLNLQDEHGQTALSNACGKNGNLETIKFLIKHGADVNLPSNSGNTPLHCAVYSTIFHKKRDLNVIKYLIKHGADVNFQNNDGNTPLHIVTNKENNNITIIKYLVKHGANIRITNNKGKKALHIASQLENNDEVINYLMQFN